MAGEMQISGYKKVSIPGGAGRLTGRYWLAKKEKAKAVIAHGLDSSMQSSKLTTLAHELCMSGFSAVQFDHMGCGESPGDLRQTTLSTRRDDFLTVAAWLEGQGAKAPLMYIGSSMGGVAALLAAGVKPPAALVAWVAPVDLADSWQRLLCGPYPPDMPLLEADRPGHDLDAILAGLRRVMLIYAEHDDVVPPKQNAKRAYDLLKEPKELWVVSGADHVFSRPEHRKQVIERSIAWLRRFVDQEVD
jgi:alpha/beta superfamily hydrolase